MIIIIQETWKEKYSLLREGPVTIECKLVFKRQRKVTVAGAGVNKGKVEAGRGQIMT